MSRHESWMYTVPVLGSIVLTSIATWLMLRGAGYIERKLSRTVMNVMMRVMGLLLAAIAVEFVLAGLREAPWK
jgi:multiple antibiotic resistance protein